MTIEQVEKHREVIKWFIDNPTKGVWRKDTPNDWYIDNTPTWYEDYTYVQNDKYAKFRKALVDDKIVQLDNQFEYDDSKLKSWIKVDKISDHIPVAHYRVKPDEFKVGDWVREKSSSFVIQAYEDMISKNFEVWKPKENELCVFWNSDNDYAVRQARNSHSAQDEYCIEWENIAPLEFIETLKG